MNAMRYTIVIIWQKTFTKNWFKQFEKQILCVEKGKQKCTTRMAIQIGRGKVNAKKSIFVVLFLLIS